MTDLDKARKWAKSRTGDHYYKSEDTQAVIDLIQSLPDNWVDVEEIKAIVEWRDNLPSGEDHDGDFYDRVRGLFEPKLPTLADMDEDTRHTMIGEDVNVEGWNNPSMLIAVHKNEGAVLGHDWINPWPFVEVRSLSELTPVNPTADQPARSSGSPESPLLCPEGCCGKCPETASGGYDCTCEDNPRCSKNNPRPQDVPANEPWLIEVDGEKYVGTRYKGDTFAPWSVAALDGSFAGDYSDNEVTLIHKLVAETTALPEGMRLADHEEYGRVVVSPKDDLDGDYRVFCPQDNTEYGANWWYAHKSDLTFLDGEA